MVATGVRRTPDSRRALLVAPTEIAYTRRPQPGLTTAELLAQAIHATRVAAGLRHEDLDGLAVSSFTLRPDTAIDLAWRCGLTLRWLEQDCTGGASGVGMLQKAIRAVAAGDARAVVVVAGDVMDKAAFSALVRSYNLTTQQHLTPLPMEGPNALFAMLTQRQMESLGLSKEDYGHLVVAQRRNAAANPGAVYRTPLTMADYLAAPVVAPPLGRFDCVPVVTGADAFIVTTRALADGPGVTVRGISLSYNSDGQRGDGLTTGLQAAASRLWDESACAPTDLDVVSVYDDYPAMVIAQLVDLGVWRADDVRGKLAELPSADPWLNTSGGQLSAGQAGAAGGMHGLVETIRRLLDAPHGTGPGRGKRPRLGLAAGYGMVAYRYGAIAGATVLEAS